MHLCADVAVRLSAFIHSLMMKRCMGWGKVQGSVRGHRGRGIVTPPTSSLENLVAPNDFSCCLALFLIISE